jgi:hypothetical protein
MIAGIIAFGVLYCASCLGAYPESGSDEKICRSNLLYFQSVISKFLDEDFDIEDYKIKRKNAIISLANLSDNFQNDF